MSGNLYFCPTNFFQLFSDMHPFLSTLHSYNRYLLLAALLFVLFRSFSGWLGNKPYTKTDNAASAALLGLTHLQLLLGLILYFATSPYTTAPGLSMKDPWVRYFKAEHIAAMLVAVVLIQLGRTFSKKAASDQEKHRKVAIYTAIATLIIAGTLAMKGLLLGTLASATGTQ
jgi:hypothetical protein